jgi:hypothetical protein
MTTATLDNGVRKTLASQIDRLDAILDGLAENLNEAVADGVKEAVTVAVQEAVHAALVEILSNAEVRRRLSVQTPVLDRLAEKARSCWNWLAGAAKGIWGKVVATATAAGDKVQAKVGSLVTEATAKVCQAPQQVIKCVRTGGMLMTTLASLAKRFRTQLLVALAVGVLVGVVCYLAGREVASVVCGVAGFIGSLAAEVVSRLRKLLPRLAGGDS